MEDDLVGRTLGQYRIDERIGRGGMAAVYRAHHAALDRTVAVKVLSSALATDAEFSERFRREALAIAQLEHPNILAIHDFGEDGGVAYIVMQFVRGGTLQDRLVGPLPLEWSIGICSQVAAALDHAHIRNIVHRDVKPANVLLSEDGNWAMLADFGIAKMLGASLNLTRTGLGVGTPAYLSPEQAHGTAVDGRSDVYSLSMMLFEMLAGTVAFPGDTPISVILKHINEPPPSLLEFRPDIPSEVDQVIQKALAKKPEDRFASAGEFAAALQDACPTYTGPRAAIPRAPGVTPKPADSSLGQLATPFAPTINVQQARGRTKQGMTRRALAGLGAAAVAVVVAIGLIVARPSDVPAVSRADAQVASPGPSNGAALIAQQTATAESIAGSVAATATAEVIAMATSEAIAVATADARATATAEAVLAQEAAIEAAVQAAVQAALASVPTATPPRPAAQQAPPPAPAPPVEQPPAERPAPPPPRPPGAPNRLAIRVTRIDCNGVAGVVTAADQPVREYVLNGSIVAPGGQATKQLEEMRVTGPEFRIDFPVALPRGTTTVRLNVAKPGMLPAALERTTVSC